MPVSPGLGLKNIMGQAWPVTPSTPENVWYWLLFPDTEFNTTFASKPDLNSNLAFGLVVWADAPSVSATGAHRSRKRLNQIYYSQQLDSFDWL
jgi:hypothetical protein